MPSSITSLPPELLDTIIQHLSRAGDKYTLRSCALVSRTWSVFSQRALFRNSQVKLRIYEKMAKLLDALISAPHLQTLIAGLTIYERRNHDDIPLSTHLSCLASMLALLPNLISVAFENEDLEDVATHSYLDLLPTVLGNAPLVELDVEVYSVETFQHAFEILGGTNIKRVSLAGFIDDQTVDSRPTWKPLHLPLLEVMRFGVDGLQEEFYDCITHYCVLPKLKQCEILTEFQNDLLHWQDLLHQGFPPLELFKWELGVDVYDDIDFTGGVAYQPIPLAGLQFQHVHLKVNPETLDMMRKFIEWWSSTFRALSDSKAVIHFTELTFACRDLPGIETLEAAWNSLDDSLAHTAFSGVRRIHLKGIGWRSELPAHPVLEDRMRLFLPQLASRGVLHFDC